VGERSRKAWGRLPRWARWVLAAYLLGFAEGTCAHVSDLARGGIHVYAAFPHRFIRVFFVSLVVLDPVAALLAVLVRRAAVWWGSAVMTLDVAANWVTNWPSVKSDPAQLLRPVGLTPITLFGVFVLASSLPLARALGTAADPASPPGEPANGCEVTRTELPS
jgi:hypothetical protein